MALAVPSSSGTRLNASTTVPLSGLSGYAAGDLIVVITCCFKGGSAIQPGTPTDDASNTYTQILFESTWTSSFRSIVGIAWAVHNGGALTTITGRGESGVSGDLAIVAFRVTGNDSSPYDTGNVNLATGTSVGSGNITTAQADEILVSGHTNDGSADTTVTPDTGGGWTAGPEGESTSFCVYSSAYKIVSSVQTGVTHTWATGASRDQSNIISAFKATAAAATVMPRKPVVLQQAVNRSYLW